MSRSIKRIAVKFILWLVIMTCLSAYVYADTPKLYLSSQSAMEKHVDNEDKVIFDYETEKLRVFAVSSQDSEPPKIYALKKMLGFWVCDYPSKRNIQGITYAGNDAYIYLLEEAGRTLYLQTEAGEKIDPVESRPLLADGTDGSGNPAISILKIADYASHLGNYRLMIQHSSGKIISAKNDELDLDSMTLVCGAYDENSQLVEYTSKELGRFGDDRAQVIDVFKQAISRKIPMEPVTFESTKMPDVEKNIYAATTLGTYYKVEGKNRIFRWDHKVNYQLVMNGEYKDVLLRHETNYMTHSLFEDGLSVINSSYKVEPSQELDALDRIYHLFFPKALTGASWLTSLRDYAARSRTLQDAMGQDGGRICRSAGRNMPRQGHHKPAVAI